MIMLIIQDRSGEPMRSAVDLISQLRLNQSQNGEETPPKSLQTITSSMKKTPSHNLSIHNLQLINGVETHLKISQKIKVIS
jgi:hypothetical protein